MRSVAWGMFLVAVAACGPSDSPPSEAAALPAPKQEEVERPLSTATPGPYARVFSDPLVQNTYKVAVDLCFYYPPEKLASGLGVANNLEAIAREHSMGSQAGAHRNAGYVGCLEGLSAPGAGQRKQFGR